MLRTRFVWLGLLTDYTVRTLVVVWLVLLTDYTVMTLVVVAAFVLIFFLNLVFCTYYRDCRRNYKSAQGRVTSVHFKYIFYLNF